jgi:hypothetical protein
MGPRTRQCDVVADRRAMVATLVFGFVFVVLGIAVLAVSTSITGFIGGLLLFWGVSAIGYGLLGLLGRRNQLR